MSGSHQVDVVGTCRFQLKENIPKPFRGDGLPGFANCNIVILTEDASQVTAGEKDGAGAFGAGNAGFLPKVEPGLLSAGLSVRNSPYGLPAGWHDICGDRGHSQTWFHG